MTVVIATEAKNDGTLLSDSDLWGLSCALQHGIQDGYFKENLEWANKMAGLIDSYRQPFTADPS
jgi:hypothetical protein